MNNLTRVRLIVEPENVRVYFPNWDTAEIDLGNAYIDITQSMDDATRVASIKKMIREHGFLNADFYRKTLPKLIELKLIEVIHE